MENNTNNLEEKLTVFRYPRTGVLQNTYGALRNIIDKNGKIKNFCTSSIKYDLQSSTSILCQYSYDDSINLILNNGLEKPRIINSRFAKLKDNTFEVIDRNQTNSTNLYDEQYIDSQTDLFLRSNSFPKFSLIDIDLGGNLMGGNYTFYIKYADEDGNLSDIVGESGIISIFHGNSVTTSNGTLLDERTNKLIILKIENLNTAFSKFALFCTRDTSDLNGILVTKCYQFEQFYDIVNPEMNLIITGYEVLLDMPLDILNITYNYYTTAKTQACTQNMLFLGNVTSASVNNSELQQLSYNIKCSVEQKEDSIGYVTGDYSTQIYYANAEYYDPINIYYYLGYWPDEFYQLGIVYLMADGSTTHAFSLLGKVFKELSETNHDGVNLEIFEKLLPVDTIINEKSYLNTGGVFKTPNVEIVNHYERWVKPLYFKFQIDEAILNKLQSLGVIGYFFVRTKRIPTNLFQGLSIGIDEYSGIPLLNNTAESFLNKSSDKEKIWNTNKDNKNVEVNEDYKDNYSYPTGYQLSNNFELHFRKGTYNGKSGALLSLDPACNIFLKGSLLWNEYALEKKYDCTIQQNERKYVLTNYNKVESNQLKLNLVYIEEDTPHYFINNCHFSTRAGSAESVREFSFLNELNYEYDADNLIRGSFCSIIGTDKYLGQNSIYNVKIANLNTKTWIESLLNNISTYYAISDRYKIDETTVIDCYRGDCFTSTSTIRLNWNFIDPTLPTMSTILDPNTWRNNYKGLNTTPLEIKDEDAEDQRCWNNINLGDVNTVPLGMWVTFKTLSNYNIGLRSVDRTNTLTTLLGSDSAFYPLIQQDARNKVPESKKLNDGLNVTLPRKYYSKYVPVSYENYHYENRIAFSNIASSKLFTNGFRVFQGLAYQDIDRQFGSIVKLLPYDQNLLCIFEHGIGIVPVNEKALLSTQMGASIHLYGSGVLQEQVSVVSDTFGSTWPDSIIKTQDSYYGVDSFTKKIWKFDAEGFKIISDFKIHSWLQTELVHSDRMFIGAINIKTHYNAKTGEVIFTFYNKDKNWSIAYNERLSQWVSKYSWTPLLSANINDDMYSFDQKRSSKMLHVLSQKYSNSEIYCEKPYKSASTNKGIILKYDNSYFPDAELKLKNIINFDVIEVTGNIIMYKDYPAGIYFYNGIPEYGLNACGIITEYPDDLVTFAENWSLYNPDVDDEGEINAEPSLDMSNYYISDYTTKVLVNNDTCLKHAFLYKFDEEYGLYIDKNWFTNDITEINIEAVDTSNNQILANENLSLLLNYELLTPFMLYKHSVDAPLTTWYDRQEAFEFEFVVNDLPQFSKVIDNLIILSNNVKPDAIEIEIDGDAYVLNKLDLFKNQSEHFPIMKIKDIVKKTCQLLYTEIISIKDKYKYRMHQDCVDIKTHGRRLGNISYIDGKWYSNISPIFYKKSKDAAYESFKIRDNFAKIRIKYSGREHAILNAIYTLMTISYV